jgi:hypothetical protein
MSTHPHPQAGPSQCALILAELLRAGGEWVGLPRLMAVSGSAAVHSRIADLRKRGHDIAHRNEQHGRAVHSYYAIRSEEQPACEHCTQGYVQDAGFMECNHCNANMEQPRPQKDHE